MSRKTPFTQILKGCEINSVPLIEEGLSRGAVLDRRDSEGWTPLMYASFFDSPEALGFLLSHKVSLSVRNSLGQSALDIAIKAENRECEKLLHNALYITRLKQAGVFYSAIRSIIEEKNKPLLEQDKLKIALSYIEWGYGWWISDENLDKALNLLKKAYITYPRVGAFPYASLLSALGEVDFAFSLLESIKQNRLGAISKKEMEKNDLFFPLREDEIRWAFLMQGW